MVKNKNNISLWKDAFDQAKWKNQSKIKELLSQINVMEGIVKKYLKLVEKDFPNLTDHSIDHSNMLWEYADIIVGDKKHYINPLEAFILNSVFLLHDGGMCYSILNNQSDIKKDSFYMDYIASNKGAMSIEELETEALFFSVRQNHGDYAIRIANELLNNEEYMIPDVNYRQEFGEIIGKICKSHTCNINYIEREFGISYSSPNFPTEWSIDYKKISYLLRTADAAHIDNLRTPKTIKMISAIVGKSKEHWTFQKKIGFPHLVSDGYLIYSTNLAFKIEEQKAWWFCYNALKTLDNELKNAENYFVSKEQEGFNAKGVKYIDDTIALGINSIKTNGWDSINTTIRVSNPIHIAAELGGVKLYGNRNIAIRELIQNSIDAIHLYRMLTDQNNLSVGKIHVGFEKVKDEYYLTVSDNGIGMSQNLLTNELLDFGGSFWKSSKFYSDFTGMAAKGFESIGKFGIGFFSAFMLSNKITVTSWKYGENINSMRTLDFYEGLLTNPILRLPNNAEKSSIIDRGTSVKLRLGKDPYKKGGIVYEDNFKTPTLKSLIQFYIPSVDVEIIITELDGTVSHLLPNSIQQLNYLELIEYINIKNESFLLDEDVSYTGISSANDKIRELPIEPIGILEKGKVVGRLALLPDKISYGLSFRDGGNSTALIMAKGIRVKPFEGAVGYINTDDVISIKRDDATKVVSYKSMREWALKQIALIKEKKLEKKYIKQLKNLQITFNLFDENFEILQTKVNGVYKFITIRELKAYIRGLKKVCIYGERKGHKKLPRTSDGLINKSFGWDEIQDVVIEKDITKLNSSEKIIKKVFKDVWGDFELKIESDIFSIEEKEPYSNTWTFTKRDKKVKKN